MAKKKNIPQQTEDEGAITLNIFNDKYFVPSSWATITPEYLYAWIEAITQECEPNEIQGFVLLKAMSNKHKEQIKAMRENATKKDKEFIDTEIYRASENLAFLQEDNRLSFGVVNNFKGMLTPNAGLSNMSIEAWVLANKYLSIFLEEKSIKALNELCSILLSPTLKGERKEFSSTTFAYAKSKMNEISLRDKYTILKMYEGELLQFAERHSKVFNTKGSSKQDSAGHIKLILGLSGDKFGNFEQTCNTPVELFILELERKIEEDEETAKAQQQ